MNKVAANLSTMELKKSIEEKNSTSTFDEPIATVIGEGIAAYNLAATLLTGDDSTMCDGEDVTSFYSSDGVNIRSEAGVLVRNENAEGKFLVVSRKELARGLGLKNWTTFELIVVDENSEEGKELINMGVKPGVFCEERRLRVVKSLKREPGL